MMVFLNLGPILLHFLYNHKNALRWSLLAIIIRGRHIDISCQYPLAQWHTYIVRQVIWLLFFFFLNMILSLPLVQSCCCCFVCPLHLPINAHSSHIHQLNFNSLSGVISLHDHCTGTPLSHKTIPVESKHQTFWQDSIIKYHLLQ